MSKRPKKGDVLRIESGFLATVEARFEGLELHTRVVKKDPFGSGLVTLGNADFTFDEADRRHTDTLQSQLTDDGFIVEPDAQGYTGCWHRRRDFVEVMSSSVLGGVRVRNLETGLTRTMKATGYVNLGAKVNLAKSWLTLFKSQKPKSKAFGGKPAPKVRRTVVDNYAPLNGVSTRSVLDRGTVRSA